MICKPVVMVVGLLTFPDRKQITKPSQEIPVTPHPLPSCTMVLVLQPPPPPPPPQLHHGLIIGSRKMAGDVNCRDAVFMGNNPCWGGTLQ